MTLLELKKLFRQVTTIRGGIFKYVKLYYIQIYFVFKRLIYEKDLITIRFFSWEI